MPRLLIAYDSADSKLGDYFLSCRHDICAHAEMCSDFQVSELSSEHDESHLQENISRFDGQPFIFVAFAHGRSDAIVLSGSPLVYAHNAYFFGQSLVYTCACSAGQALAKDLRIQNCRVFIGFLEDSKLPPRASDYEGIFMLCENYGLKAFMQGGISIGIAFSAMQNTYTEQAISLYATNFVAASLLLQNRDALHLDADGNEHLTLTDFI